MDRGNMVELSQRIRMQVLLYYFLGFSYDDIVKAMKDTSVSKGSVVNIVKELKEGVYPEFDDILDEVEGLRELASSIKNSNLTSQEARLGLVFFDQLTKLGVEPQDLKHWVRLCRGIISEEYPVEKLVEAAVRLVKYEEKTGKNYSEILAELEKMSAEKEKLQGEVKELEYSLKQLKESAKKESERLEGEVTGRRKELDEVSKKLDLMIAGSEGLKKCGVDKVADLTRFIGNYEELGFDAEEVKSLAELKRELKELGAEPSKINKWIKEKGSLESQMLKVKAEAEHWLKLRSSILEKVPFLIAIERIFRDKTTTLQCQYCRNPVPVRVETRTTYDDLIANRSMVYELCPSCGQQNYFRPSGVLASIGWQLLPP